MSETALRDYQAAVAAQHNRNEARRIRARVNEARHNPHPAGMRWPFELLQNALDAGPRKGAVSVAVRLRQEPSKVVFEHDGAPFSLSDLAALLSGGSNKEFESDVTTGRFGTGFLVTHVLSEKAMISGILEAAAAYERFSVILDRGGSEDAILKNIEGCAESIRKAVRVDKIDDVASAVIEYAIDDIQAWDLGIQAFRQALPYVFATRPNLGRVYIEAGGVSESWFAEAVESAEVDDGFAEARLISVEQGDLVSSMRVFRFTASMEADASALVLVNQSGDSCEVRPLGQGAPRIYREYPIRGSTFL
jgi:hypothetical protein